MDRLEHTRVVPSARCVLCRHTCAVRSQRPAARPVSLPGICPHYPPMAMEPALAIASHGTRGHAWSARDRLGDPRGRHGGCQRLSELNASQSSFSSGHAYGHHPQAAHTCSGDNARLLHGSARFHGACRSRELLIVERDGAQIHFFHFAKLDPRTNYGQVYIRTNDVDALNAALIARGTPIHPSGAL